MKKRNKKKRIAKSDEELYIKFKPLDEFEVKAKIISIEKWKPKTLD